MGPGQVGPGGGKETGCEESDLDPFTGLCFLQFLRYLYYLDGLIVRERRVSKRHSRFKPLLCSRFF